MPQLLYAAAFALEDRELFADYSCGDEPWSLAAAEWIQGGGVERSVTQHGTQVCYMCMSRTREPGGFTRGVTAIPPSGGGVVEGRLFSLDTVFDEVVPFAV
jgi:hypothetical protein